MTVHRHAGRVRVTTDLPRTAVVAPEVRVPVAAHAYGLYTADDGSATASTRPLLGRRLLPMITSLWRRR